MSPDGKHVVVQAGGELWIYDVARATRTRLRAKGTRPIWMPDGRSILFNAKGKLYAVSVDGTSEPRLVLAPERGFAFPLGWSKDGRVLVYSNPIPEAMQSRDGGCFRPVANRGHF